MQKRLADETPEITVRAHNAVKRSTLARTPKQARRAPEELRALAN